MGLFNLVDEPWIPCTMNNGRIEFLGLKQVFQDAHCYKDISDPSPIVTVALFRLLLAILHRLFGPANSEEWIALWERRCFPPEKLEGYFREWHHRFYLFDEKRPFYQTILDEGITHPPQLLALEAAAGNNATLFDHSTDIAGKKMDPAVAARYLVTRQAYSIGFGKSSPFYFSDSTLIRGLCVLLMGTNLFESLLLNMIRYTDERPIPQKRGECDEPSWEQDVPPEPRSKGNVPKGYLDYLTWQSRRIYLIQDENANSVSGCKILQNLKLPDPPPLDPFKCYEVMEKRGFVSKGFREEKALWRDYHVLLQTGVESSKRPEVLDWVAELAARKPEDFSTEYSFKVVGLATDKGKAASLNFWRQEILPLPLEYLSQKDLLETLKSFLILSETTGKKLESALWYFIRLFLFPDEDQEPGKEEENKIQEILKETAPTRSFWPRLETPFKEIIEKLPDDYSEGVDGALVYGGKCYSQWRDLLWKTALYSFNLAVTSFGNSARVLKARAKAETSFLGALKNVLQNQEEPQEKEGSMKP